MILMRIVLVLFDQVHQSTERLQVRIWKQHVSRHIPYIPPNMRQTLFTGSLSSVESSELFSGDLRQFRGAFFGKRLQLAACFGKALIRAEREKGCCCHNIRVHSTRLRLQQVNMSAFSSCYAALWDHWSLFFFFNVRAGSSGVWLNTS